MDFSKAFPERVALSKLLTARQRLADEGRNPFGGDLSETAHGDLTKLAKLDHVFKERQRVSIHRPGSVEHGRAGTITALIQNGDRARVHLDSGHEVNVHHTEILPEDFFADAGADSDKVRKSRLKLGDRVIYRGKPGRVFRFTGRTPGDTRDDGHMVHIILDGDTHAVGLDVRLQDLQLEDDDVSMDISGRIHLRPEAHFEQVPDVVRTFIDALKNYGRVICDTSNRAEFEKHEPLRALIAAGRIQFQASTLAK